MGAHNFFGTVNNTRNVVYFLITDLTQQPAC